MWSWIKGLVSSASSSSAPGQPSAAVPTGGLDPAALKTLVEGLLVLDSVGAGLGERAAGFVITGNGGEVVDHLAMTKGGGATLKLTVCSTYFTVKKVWAGWFSQAKPSLEILHRLGLVFEAVSRQERNTVAVQDLGLPAWMAVLLWELSTASPGSYSSSDKVLLDHGVCEDLLRIGGHPVDTILTALFSVQGKSVTYGPTHLLSLIPDLPTAVARLPQVVRKQLQVADSRSRVLYMEFLRARSCSSEPFTKVLAEFLVGDAKTVREGAEAWSSAKHPDLLNEIRRFAAEGEPAQRSHALAFIARHVSTDAVTFLRERMVQETSPAIRKQIEDLIIQSQAANAPTVGTALLTAITVPDVQPLSAVGHAALATLVESWYRSESTWWANEERRVLAFNAGDPRRCATVPKKPVAFSTDDIQRLVGLLERPGLSITDLKAWGRDLTPGRTWQVIAPAIQQVFKDPQVTLAHVVRLSLLIGRGVNDYHLRLWLDHCLVQYIKATRATTGTRVVFALLESLGVKATELPWSLLESYNGVRWPLADLWEWFCEHPEIIASALGQGDAAAARSSWNESYRFTNALALLERFPEVQPGLQPVLWSLAFGSVTVKRLPAQRALARVPGILSRVLAGLSDGKQDTRLYAAEWLTALKDPAAIAPLEAVVGKEKQEAVKAAMMTALETLGVPIDRFLDRPGLDKAAAKGLAKGIPEDLAWLSFASLPLPAWRDGSGTLSREVLSWWIVQAVKLKDPEPTPLLRRYAAMLDQTQAATLGQYLLQAWINADTSGPTSEQLAEHVQQHGAQLMSQAQSMVSYMTVNGVGPTVQHCYDQLLEHYRTTPLETRISTKGVLAVAAAMGGPGLAPLVAPYLKRWYGLRAAQGKALLQMLSAVDHPTAIQVLLATATRFRTAGIRKEAEECVQQVAQRRGWTVDELADRTIPAAGLDEQGLLTLSYGARIITARLLPDLDLQLQDDAGKVLAGLPAARAGDEAEAVEQAKKQFSDTKKQVKTIVKQQAERLYEAMCTGRRWSAADWRTYLLSHPIAGRLCRQVVWLATGVGKPVAGKPPVSFRALEDGTLTDVEDTAVALPDDAVVQVAHPLQIAAAICSAWTKHLADYEVEPLFAQFGRTPWVLPQDLAEEQALVDHRGHVLDTFKLRGRATKLDWTRGQAEDGGWFHVYRKHFPATGLTAVLDFTGNSLPEENRPCAITGLRFERSVPQGEAEDCTLSEIPGPLLSECWNDVHEIAAQGTGFDPDWETKTSN